MIEFENQVSEEFTVVDTDVQNGVGVLYAITSLLAEFDLDVHTAIITTVADRARDAFYVVDDKGQKDRQLPADGEDARAPPRHPRVRARAGTA